jgi:DegV family protein with EDD domain
MTEHKIAILTDSGCDIPQALLKRHKIYRLPLSLIFKDAHYRDDDISATELYQRMEEEIPTTSLPSGEDVAEMLRRIRADGYDKVLAVSISSRLSGTCNMLRLHERSQQGLEMAVVDSRNISIGAGLLALKAARYLEQGAAWAGLKERLHKEVQNSKVFFCLKSLDYLRQGGRIGHVSALLGSALKLKPIITCDSEGVYTTAAKVIGYKQALQRLSECARQFAAEAPVRIAVMHGAAAAEAAQVKEKILTLLPQAKLEAEAQVSPALAVHTGPGLVGIGLLRSPALSGEC